MQQKITVAGSGVRMTARKTTPGLDDRAHGVNSGQSAADQLMPSGIGPVGFPSDPQEGAISDLFGIAGHRPAVKPLTVFRAELYRCRGSELGRAVRRLHRAEGDHLFQQRRDAAALCRIGSTTWRWCSARKPSCRRSIWRWRRRARPSRATASATRWSIRRPWSRRCRASSAAAGGKLLERVAAGTLRFRLLRGRPSHEKLYLLSGPAGHRVLTGSANLSLAAFEGRQHEIHVAFDGEPAWRLFDGYYQRDWKDSVPVEPDALVTVRADGTPAPRDDAAGAG